MAEYIRNMTVQVRVLEETAGYAHCGVRVQDDTKQSFDLCAQIAAELVTGKEEEILAAALGGFCQAWLDRIREQRAVGDAGPYKGDGGAADG